MKKRMLMLVSCLLVMVMVYSGCSAPIAPEQGNSESEVKVKTDESKAEAVKSEEKVYKIGISFSDLSNAVWAELVEYAENYAFNEYNCEITVVQFNDDPVKQVAQIENFVQGGYDGIIACPTDPDSIEDACKAAREAGVAVCIYTSSMENQDFDYNVAEYDTGYAAGQACADWIETRETLMSKEEIKIGICNYRLIPTVIGREDGFEAAITERFDNINIAIRAQALTQEEGLNAAETFFQAHPDLDIIYSIGDGGGLGANEAAKGAGKDTDDFGIFCVDATLEACKAINNNESIRASISLGGGKAHAQDMIDGLMKVIKGEEVEPHFFMPITPISIKNLAEYAEKQGYVLD